MYCMKCGGEVPEKSKFCHHCGAEIGNASSSLKKESSAPSDESKAQEENFSTRQKALAIGLIAGIVLSIGILSTIGFGASSSSHNASFSSSSPQETVQDGSSESSSSSNSVSVIGGKISRVDVPEDANEKEPSVATIHVKNTGDVTSSFRVELKYSGDTVSEESSISPGSSRSYSLNFTPTREDSTLEIRLFADGSLLDSRTVSVTVKYVDGELKNVQIPSSVEEGNSLTASGKVRNIGTIGKTFKVKLESSSTSTSEQVYLSESESEDVKLSITPNRGDSKVSFSLYADDELLNNQESSITVQYVDGKITSMDIPSSVKEGKSIEISFGIKNTGNTAGDFDIEMDDSTKSVHLVGGSSSTLDFSTEFYRSDDSRTVSLYHDDKLLDSKSETVTVLYPELTLSWKSGGHSWGRDNSDLPIATASGKYEITNKGTGAAENVTLKLYQNGDFVESKTISEIAPSGESSGEFSVKTEPQTESIDGTLCRTSFDVESSLEVRYSGDDLSKSFSRSISRNELEYGKSEKYLITPDDPVVQEKLNDLLDDQAWWDGRAPEEYLLDWVGDTSVGVGGVEIIDDWGVEYDHDGKYPNTDEWYSDHNYWRQLPRETIRSKEGVCIDQAILYTTFLRAYGYSAEDVYVICGEGWGNPHAWVAIRGGFMGNDDWDLVETTAGGMKRVLSGTVGDTLRAVHDWIRTEVLDQEDAQMYEEVYRFNDKHFEKVSGNWDY